MEAAARADLVICNGGSPTAQQALAAGTPVLGICSNLDQYLNMQAVEQAGAGKLLRAGKAGRSAIRAAVDELLEGQRYREGAGKMAERYQSHVATERFAALVEHILSGGSK